jgi:hypothetical protein
MGWYGSYNVSSAKEMREEILRECKSSGRVLGTVTKGNELWVAMDHDKDRSITLFLVESHEGVWSYKPIHEDMGPFYYTASVAKLLALCPDEGKRSESSREWRRLLRQHIARGKRQFEVGAAVMVYGQPYTIVGEHTRTKMLVRMPNGELRAAKKADIVLV